jgi:hypothetical protein
VSATLGTIPNTALFGMVSPARQGGAPQPRQQARSASTAGAQAQARGPVTVRVLSRLALPADQHPALATAAGRPVEACAPEGRPDRPADSGDESNLRLSATSHPKYPPLESSYRRQLTRQAQESGALGGRSDPPAARARSGAAVETRRNRDGPRAHAPPPPLHLAASWPAGASLGRAARGNIWS